MRTVHGTYLPFVVKGCPILVKQAEEPAPTQVEPAPTHAEVPPPSLLAEVNWGCAIRGIDLGDGWVRRSDDGVYLAMAGRGLPVMASRLRPWQHKRVQSIVQMALAKEEATAPDSKQEAAPPEDEVEFLVDNSRLKAKVPGVKYRRSPDFADTHETFAQWDEVVRGIDVGGGWIRTSSGLHLPAEHKGIPIVVRVAEYVLDNSQLQSTGPGVKYRRSAMFNDQVETFAGWGEVVRGIDLGNGWFRATTGMFLPTEHCGAPVLTLKRPEPTQLPKVTLKAQSTVAMEWVLDSRMLNTKAPGVRYRNTQQLEDKHERLGQWGEVVRGVDLGDGWFRTSDGMFLPTEHKGAQLLFPVARPVGEDGAQIFLADNALLQATSNGMQHRRSKRLDDIDPTWGTKWGTTLCGVDEGDGWVRVCDTGMYLPLQLKGKLVLTPQLVDLSRPSTTTTQNIAPTPSFGQPFD